MNRIFRYNGSGLHYTGPCGLLGIDVASAIHSNQIVVYLDQAGADRFILLENGRIRTLEYAFWKSTDFVEI